eukprot:81734-Pyramimonas_sp.AAC.1
MGKLPPTSATTRSSTRGASSGGPPRPCWTSLGGEQERAFSESSEGLLPSEKWCKPSPKTQQISQQVRGLLRSPA